MAHGTPDYGVTNAGEIAYRVTDLGELAARLGSIVTYDRRGDVIWLDDFEHSLNKWSVAAGGGASAGTISSAQARNGGNSCNLHLDTNANAVVNITHIMPPPSPAMTGVEFSVQFDAHTVSFQVLVGIFDGVHEFIGELKYTPATQLLQYLDHNGVLQTVAAALNLSAQITLFHNVKLVVDAAAMTYARAIVNGTTYDLSNIALQSVASAQSPHLFLQITANGSAAGASDVYVDDVVVTQNEP